MVFTEDEKIKIWLHYMSTQIALRHDIHYFKDYQTWENKYDDSYLKYPILNVATKQLWLNAKVRPFDDFCNEENELSAYGIKGWYWRFKDKIFKE
jgi:hypothetical protein